MHSNNAIMKGLIQLKEIYTLLQKWIREGKVGNVQVNIFKGGVTSYNVNETFAFKGKETTHDVDQHKHNT